MGKSKKKNNMLWFKKWWYDWAKLDLTVLPIGVALAYYLKDYANGFWLNLSTELIGAYISIRFIDYLLKRTEHKHYERREIAGNLNWFFENADRLIPDFYDWRIKDLENEIKWFDERWDERKRLLEEDEISLVEDIRESRNKIVSLAKEYIGLYQAIERIDAAAYDNVQKIPKWWRDLSHDYHEYRKTIINAEEIIVPALESALSGISELGELSNEESEYLRTFIVKVQQLKTIRDAVEEEVRRHEKLTYNLKNNIFQESG